jgi:hypothetical protein
MARVGYGDKEGHQGGYDSLCVPHHGVPLDALGEWFC